jgi:hypothetical protein
MESQNMLELSFVAKTQSKLPQKYQPKYHKNTNQITTKIPTKMPQKHQVNLCKSIVNTSTFDIKKIKIKTKK